MSTIRDAWRCQWYAVRYARSMKASICRERGERTIMMQKQLAIDSIAGICFHFSSSIHSCRRTFHLLNQGYPFLLQKWQPLFRRILTLFPPKLTLLREKFAIERYTTSNPCRRLFSMLETKLVRRAFALHELHHCGGMF